MKVVSKSGKEFTVVQMNGANGILLEEVLTRKSRTVKPTTFKEDYKLIDGEVDEELSITIPTPEEEIKDSLERAQEILKEIDKAVEGKEEQVTKTKKELKQEQKLKDDKEEKPKKDKKEDKSKEDKKESNSNPVKSDGVEDLITIKELCIEAKIDETKARRILRKADIARPYNRWEWSRSEHKELVEKVRQLLSK